ncbi:hypothetical protein FRC05_001398 [Tulasnella sp. 425]|nr:hypothetical protein FRC05_001398 [Tulasnella sp. 425]
MPTSLDAMARFFKGSSLRQGSAGPQLANTTEYAPLTGTWLRRHWRPFNLQSGHANIFIIICLCYRDVEWAEGGSMTLKGPREDLTLLLQRVQYRHQNETRQFLIFTDFEMDFQDHTGHSHQVPTIPATHRNIELRTWLALSRFPTTTIIAILDACHSALPYLHDKDGKWVNRSEPASEVQMKSQVIEISSTTKPQSSYSAKYPEDQGDSGTTHGIFTWNLLQALKGRNFREPGA